MAERSVFRVNIPPRTEGVEISLPGETVCVDVGEIQFPLIVKFGDKEYMLIKTRFGKLCLNGKNS